jgi:AcrR family transcriptional regulator
MASAAAPSPRRLPRAERERQILDVAHQRFAAQGYANVTMDGVAAEVGVTKPLLYAYWGNKERIYLACLEQDAARLFETVGAAVGSAPNPADATAVGLRAFFDFVSTESGAFRVLFDETQPAGGEIAQRVTEHRERIASLVATTLLEQMPPSSRAKARVEVEALSNAVLGAAEALARWWLRTGEQIPAADAAELLIATVVPGLRARTSIEPGELK